MTAREGRALVLHMMTEKYWPEFESQVMTMRAAVVKRRNYASDDGTTP